MEKHGPVFNNINEIYKRISRAAMKAGRGPEEIRLIGVTKYIRSDAVVEAVEAGLRDFGESRVQEAEEKIPRVLSKTGGCAVAWHLVGHLQKNKAKKAVELFDLIHSVDSVDLAETINNYAGKTGKMQRILIQVKLSHEESKYGISKDKLLYFLEKTGDLKNLGTEGLMTIPPLSDDPEDARPYFRSLRKLRDEAVKAGYVMKELSMGMSDDFEAAIEEGATMVRVGTAIFGGRDLTT
jgi:hypothetical protein